MKKQSAKAKPKRTRETSAGYRTVPAPDKKQLIEMLEAYRRINIEKERERLRRSRERTPTEAFEAFLDLWEFGRDFASHNPRQRQEKIASMLRYYERIKQFEAWRRERAR
jgi:hypothetical protein